MPVSYRFFAPKRAVLLIYDRGIRIIGTAVFV